MGKPWQVTRNYDPPVMIRQRWKFEYQICVGDDFLTEGESWSAKHVFQKKIAGLHLLSSEISCEFA